MVPVTSLPERFVRIPSHPCTYTLLMAESLKYTGINEATPTIVDMDHSIFIHPNNEKTVCGGFIEEEIRALPLPQGIQTEWVIPAPDWDRFCKSFGVPWKIKPFWFKKFRCLKSVCGFYQN